MGTRLYSGMTADEAKYAAYTEELTGTPHHHIQYMTDRGDHYTCDSGGCDAKVTVDPAVVPDGTKRF